MNRSERGLMVVLAGVLLCGVTASAAEVSGWVSGLKAGATVTIKLEGSYAYQAATGPGGQWSITGVANGTYQTTPEAAGYTFEPPVRPVKVVGGVVQAVNFKAVAIKGPAVRVGALTGSVSGLPGRTKVVMVLEGRYKTETPCRPGGQFLVNPDAPGNYRLRPRDETYRFIPEEVFVTAGSEEQKGFKFVAERKPKSSRIVETPAPGPGLDGPVVEVPPPATLVLSGKVAGLKTPGVAVIRADGPKYATVKTDPDGAFSLAGLPPGRYTINVELPDCPGCQYILLPEGMIVALDHDIGGLLFTATARP